MTSKAFAYSSAQLRFLLQIRTAHSCVKLRNSLSLPQKPDTKLSWEQRNIGGLGIFLVLEETDAVRYAYEDNKNILTVEKVCAANNSCNS